MRLKQGAFRIKPRGVGLFVGLYRKVQQIRKLVQDGFDRDEGCCVRHVHGQLSKCRCRRRAKKCKSFLLILPPKFEIQYQPCDLRMSFPLPIGSFSIFVGASAGEVDLYERLYDCDPLLSWMLIDFVELK